VIGYHMNSTSIRGSWRISAIIAFTLMANAALAQSAVIFERAKIRIDATLSAKEIEEKAPSRPSIEYSVELRPESALNLENIHTLNVLTPTTGVLIALNTPSLVTLPAMKVYTPVDVLFVAYDGTISQIMPEVVLGQITQTVEAKSPIKALLFLKSGEASALDIRPRDVVAGNMFTPTAAVQE
jgi:uncharacterized membrane protein (UPF0127 family)